MKGGFVCVVLLAVALGCRTSPNGEGRATTRPTTQAAVPRDMIILSTLDGFGLEVEVEEAGPYRLYASNAPGHILGTARLQAGGMLRFRQRGLHVIETDYATGKEWGTFSVPAKENVEYFWVRGAWNP